MEIGNKDSSVTCKFDGCNNIIYARGWCRKHYLRWWKYNDPNTMLRERYGCCSHPLYQVLQNIKARCYNKNNCSYKDYGDRGIMVCDKWRNSAKSFIEWCLANGWERGLEIDRKNNDGNYCPENCRFVTHKENCHNQRLLRKNNTSGYRGVSCKGEKWAARIRINGKRKQIGHFNMPEEAALAYDEAVPDNRPRNFI